MPEATLLSRDTGERDPRGWLHGRGNRSRPQARREKAACYPHCSGSADRPPQAGPEGAGLPGPGRGRARRTRGAARGRTRAGRRLRHDRRRNLGNSARTRPAAATARRPRERPPDRPAGHPGSGECAIRPAGADRGPARRIDRTQQHRPGHHTSRAWPDPPWAARISRQPHRLRRPDPPAHKPARPGPATPAGPPHRPHHPDRARPAPPPQHRGPATPTSPPHRPHQPDPPRPAPPHRPGPATPASPPRQPHRRDRPQPARMPRQPHRPRRPRPAHAVPRLDPPARNLARPGPATSA